MLNYKRYNSDKKLDKNGEWVRYDEVRDIPRIHEASRYYINAWGNTIWDENGEWIPHYWVQNSLNKREKKEE